MTPDTRGLSESEAAELLVGLTRITDGEFGELLLEPHERAACLLGAAALRQTTWQPIATAPRDGTAVLVAWRRLDHVDVAYCAADGVWHDDDGANFTRPDLWMAILPLPAPPVAEGETR